jgi:CheY-like chemotaxis protein
MSTPLLKLKDAAELLKVAPVTVRLWTEKGMLAAERTPGGHRRYQLHEIKRFAVEHGVTLDNKDRSLRVLIVDDDQKWLTLLSTMISKKAPNTHIDTAMNGFSAGKKLASFKPDIVILDLRMPGLSGLDVCKDIKSTPELSKTRVIAMTGFASGVEKDEILAAGAEACLQKPLDFAELFLLIGLDSASHG